MTRPLVELIVIILLTLLEGFFVASGTALVDKLLDAAAPDPDDSDLAGDEKPFEQRQQDDDDELNQCASSGSIVIILLMLLEGFFVAGEIALVSIRRRRTLRAASAG